MLTKLYGKSRLPEMPETRYSPAKLSGIKLDIISGDPDEKSAAYIMNYVGPDKFMWASDYPHPDAKFPGVVEELAESTESLSEAQRRRIFGENAVELYSLPAVRQPSAV